MNGAALGLFASSVTRPPVLHIKLDDSDGTKALVKITAFGNGFEKNRFYLLISFSMATILMRAERISSSLSPQRA